MRRSRVRIMLGIPQIERRIKKVRKPQIGPTEKKIHAKVHYKFLINQKLSG